MAIVNIIIADDMENIHADLRDTLNSISFPYKIVKDFYDTSSLKRYLRKLIKSSDEEGVDVLILDHDFGGTGENGLEALPVIRKYAPRLPIIFLTTYDDLQFDVIMEYKDVEYVQKPVKASDLRFRIKSIMYRAAQWEEFEKELKEDKEMVKYLMEENEHLETLANQDIEKKLPLKMQELIQNIFPDIEFKALAFRLLLKKGIGQKDWNRIFRTLKIIDWKSDSTACAGVKIQKFKEASRLHLGNVWEYRFSQAGRIFVQRRENEKPLLLLIDPSHSYSDNLAF